MLETRCSAEPRLGMFAAPPTGSRGAHLLNPPRRRVGGQHLHAGARQRGPVHVLDEMCQKARVQQLEAAARQRLERRNGAAARHLLRAQRGAPLADEALQVRQVVAEEGGGAGGAADGAHGSEGHVGEEQLAPRVVPRRRQLRLHARHVLLHGGSCSRPRRGGAHARPVFEGSAPAGRRPRAR